MSTFEKTIFTNLGISFINDLNSARSKLVSATSVYSSSDLSGMSDDDIKAMTDIANKELTASCDIVKIDNHQTKIRSIANNESLKQGIYIRAYATYVVDQNGTQTLFAIKVNTKPQYLPAFDGVNTNAQSYGFNVGISQTDSVMFTKLSNLNATVQDLKNLDDKTTDALASKVSFSGGKITTGNGTFVPLSVDDINSTNNKTLQFRQIWDGNIQDLVNQLPGVYEIGNGNKAGAPDGFAGYGSALVYKTTSDTFIILADNGSRHWFGHQASYGWTGWSEVASQDALNSKVSFDGGKITTGNGTFVPAALETVNNQLATKANAADVNDALSKKVSFDGGKITTAYGSFVPASVETLQGIIDKSFQYHGKWTAPLANMNNALSGIYQLDLTNTNAGNVLNGWDGYGAAVVYNNGVDCYVTIYGHNGLQWNNHTINGTFVAWQSLPTQSDVNSLQSQVNANASNDVRYRGEWNNKGIWSLKDQPDGIYWVSYNNNDVVPGWNKVNSMVTKTSIPSGCLLRLTDSVGNEWITNNFTNNTFFSWVKLN